MTVFVSDALGGERLPFRAAPPSPLPGRAGWAALSACYRDGLAALGLAVSRVQRPEIYGAEVARAVRGVRAGDWHLAVTPLAHLRPFHGLPDVFAVDWPYAEPPGPVGLPPFPDVLRLLRGAAAVACPTAAAARGLRAAGLARVVHLPPYVPGGGVGAPSTRAGTDGVRFLAVLPEGPGPRDLDPLVEGFAMARARCGDLRLAVALPGHGPPPGPLTAGVDVVRAADLPGLLDGADFLLSTAAPGASSLPRIGAMLAGVPLVAPVAGAGDHPGPGEAVPLAVHPAEVRAEEEPLARRLALTLPRPAAAAVRDAVLAAASLDPAGRARIAGAARRAAGEAHGLPAFEAGLREIEAHVREWAP